MEDIYCSVLEVRKVFENRRHLRKKIEAWWKSQGWHIPLDFFQTDPIAGFGRAVATRRYEDILFSLSASRLGFRPVWMEYTESTLSTHSPFKRSLLQPVFYVKHGKNNGMVVETRKLAPLQNNRTKRLSEIMLDNGDSLIEYHHRLHHLFGFEESAIIDLSEFYGQFGSAAQYYMPYLSLFLAHAVLFEDYHGGEEAGADLDQFTESIFMPAFRELQNIFGISPIVVQMPWHENLKYYAPSGGTECVAHKVFPCGLFGEASMNMV